MKLSRKIGTGTDVGNAGLSGILVLTAGQEVYIEVRTRGAGGDDVIVEDANLTIHRIGD